MKIIKYKNGKVKIISGFAGDLEAHNRLIVHVAKLLEKEGRNRKETLDADGNKIIEFTHSFDDLQIMEF